MDSGNISGSMQSSSSGDEEYDSHAESSISAFLNNPPPPSHVVGPFSTSATNLPTSQPSPLQHRHNTHMFDPLANYLDPTQRSPSLANQNSLLSPDMMWSKLARSEPNPTDLGGLIPCLSSSPSPQNQAFLSTQLPRQIRGTYAFLTTHHNPLPLESASRGLLSVSAANNDQAHNTNTITNTTNNNVVVRNPKKRSRASRRAPTTVLTTDTTNFRAMVQEFTGIPAPPFTSSPLPRSRLDLFGSVAASTIRSTHLDPPQPPYLLRPFAQKPHPPHPLPPSTSSIPSSSMVDTLLAFNSSTNSSTNSTSMNYQLFSSSADHLGLLKQPLNFNNMHNPILSFQTILQQAPPKYHPLGSSSVLASKTQPSVEILPSDDNSHLRLGVLEELGLRHVHVNNTDVSGLHQNMVSSPFVGALSSGNNNNLSNTSREWDQRMGTTTNNDCGDHEGVLRSLSGTFNHGNIAERVTNGKVHYSASSLDFHGEKGLECIVATRSEGTVDSWINCSPD